MYKMLRKISWHIILLLGKFANNKSQFHEKKKKTLNSKSIYKSNRISLLCSSTRATKKTLSTINKVNK